VLLHTLDQLLFDTNTRLSSVYWYQKAANQGQAEAQYNLGIAYTFGKGVLKDYKPPLPKAYAIPRLDCASAYP
jgi:TPR repeat protein